MMGLLIAGCSNQTKSNGGGAREYIFPQVGWKIKVPEDLTVMDSARANELNSKGLSAVEKTYDTTVDARDTKTLIAIQKDENNLLTSTISPFEASRDGDWQERINERKSLIMETYQSQRPDVKLDTSTAHEKIDGVEFQKFHITTTYPDNKVRHAFMYSTLKNGFDYGISVSYMDEKVGKELTDIVEKSAFQTK